MVFRTKRLWFQTPGKRVGTHLFRAHQQAAGSVHGRTDQVLAGSFFHQDVLAELDYLLMRHLGRRAQGALLEEIARGAYRLEGFDAADVARAKEVIEKYEDLDVGLADASLVVLAERHTISEVLTLDQRHFRALRFARRRRFRILPFDIGAKPP